VVTADHAGVWDFSDPNQENEWLAKAWGSQMELRAIQKRNRDETIRARHAGEPKQRPSYGYMYVRLVPMGKVDHVALDEVGAEIIREVARRILADQTGKITIGTEAVRLTREGIPCPGDRRAQLSGRPVKGGPWTAHTLKHILCSEAALGYLMHGGRPVLGADGRPVRIAGPLWDRATLEAVPDRAGPRDPRGRFRPRGYCAPAPRVRADRHRAGHPPRLPGRHHRTPGRRVDNAGNPRRPDGSRPARDLSQVPDQGPRGSVHRLFRRRIHRRGHQDSGQPASGTRAKPRVGWPRRRGPKPRLVPLVNGADRNLRWFIEGVWGPVTTTSGTNTTRVRAR
jgi:hypothetical protein